MGNNVHVSSIQSLETFRSSLIVFITEAQRSIDDVQDQVRRIRGWVQGDRRTHWEGEIRRWRRALDQANQELISARLSGLRDTTTAQEMAVRRAREGLAHAEAKLRASKHWGRDYDSVVMPMLKQVETLRHYLDFDMTKALAFLVNAQRTLESYAEIQRPTMRGQSPEAAPDGAQGQPGGQAAGDTKP